MNYRHAYHAGNHGDVLKHAILSRVLAYMTLKDKPIAVLDAHAGIGRYDLSGVEAFKTGEWHDGIGKLLAAPLSTETADLLKPYIDLIQSLNPNGGVQHYPGSPEIACHALRPQDRLMFNELHPEDRHLLAARYTTDSRVRVSGLDAQQAVKAHLPFIERRGVLLLDPAYEVADETDRVARMVKQALQRMASVTILVWYPVTTLTFANDLCSAVQAECRSTTALDARLMVKEPHVESGLSGSGIIAINPPWTLHNELTIILPALAELLGKGRWGKGSVTWVTPPR